MILTVLIGLLFSACAVDIIDVTGSVSGVVKDYVTGQTVENCQVTLSPIGTTVFTNAHGGYSFTDVQPYVYTLTFSKIGYMDQTASVEVVAGQMVVKDIMLKNVEEFTVSHSVLDFGDISSTLSFSLQNPTAGKYNFTIANDIPWLRFSQTNGTIQANNKLDITASVDRSLVGYGSYDKTFTINYNGATSGNVVVRAVMNKVQQAAPTVETLDPTDITANSFSIGGYITSTGGEMVTEYGHCWSYNPNPTIDNDHSSLGKTTENIRYVSKVYCSLVNTTVYVRAYAKNSKGISYGQEVRVTSQSEDSSEDGDFAGGKGTAYDPYQIRKAAHMLKMRDYPEAYFKLIEDIDMEGSLWTPIPMNTSFDGNNYTIYNLTINPYITSDKIGLFSTVDKGVVKNLTLHNVSANFPNRSYIGAIAGYSDNSATITNCHVVLTQANSIIGKDYVGGLVGYAQGGGNYNDGTTIISSCTVSSTTNSVTIIGSNHVGGAIGNISDRGTSTVSDILVNTCIAGIVDVGGIAGCVDAVTHNRHVLEQLSFEGTITALTTDGFAVGGLVGALNSYNVITSSKANAIIEGNPRNAGGLVGYDHGGSSSIIACYSQGQIVGNNNGNGIVGSSYRAKNIKYCYTLYNSTIPSSWGESFSIYDLVSQFNSPINIAEIMRANCSTEATQYWDYDRTWTWKGTANGKSVTAICPKLKWEK